LEGDDFSDTEKLSCIGILEGIKSERAIAALAENHLSITLSSSILPANGSVIVFNFALAGIIITLYKLNKVNHNLVVLTLFILRALRSLVPIMLGNPDFDSLGKGSSGSSSLRELRG
jgi:hypothetical protein